MKSTILLTLPLFLILVLGLASCASHPPKVAADLENTDIIDLGGDDLGISEVIDKDGNRMSVPEIPGTQLVVHTLKGGHKIFALPAYEVSASMTGDFRHWRFVDGRTNRVIAVAEILDPLAAWALYERLMGEGLVSVTNPAPPTLTDQDVLLHFGSKFDPEKNATDLP